MAKDHTSFKDCPHCAYSFGAAERSAFVKAQFLEHLFCPNCNGKSFIVVPGQKRFNYKLSVISVFFIVTFILFVLSVGLVVAFGSFMQGEVAQEHSRASQHIVKFRLLPLLITGGMILGVVLMVKRFASRFIMWHFAHVQKTPYVDAQ